MSEKIELTFKSPTDRISPFIATVDKSWDVSKLKAYLMENYPSKPTIESQKIIYCGKLLKNEQVLQKIFQDKKSVIVHFLSQPSITVPEESKPNIMEKENEDELYKEYQAYLTGFYSNNIQNFTSLSPYQQYVWINQAYMQSYASYYNQFQTSTSEANNTVIQRTVTNESNGQNVDNQVIENDRPVNAVNAEQNGVQNVVAAAFNGIVGGGEDDNDGDAEPRDILHYFYMLVRLGLLLIICYYYSSGFSIFVTVMLFCLFVGVNFVRRYNARPAVNPPMNNNPVPNEPVSNDQQGDNNENKETEANVESTNISPSETTSQPLVQEQQSGETGQTQQAPQNDVIVDLPPSIFERIGHIASGTANFVVTFFLTLFPDPIADINAN